MKNKTIVIRGRRYRIAHRINQRTTASKRTKSIRHREAKAGRVAKDGFETWVPPTDTLCGHPMWFDCGPWCELFLFGELLD